MEDLKTIFQIFERLLEIHIKTKTKDSVFHGFTAGVYEKAFDVFHRVSEKMEDIGEWMEQEDLQEMKNETYEIVEELKDIVDWMKDKYSTWMDNLVRWLVDEIESICGNARSFVKENEGENEDEKY